MNRKTNLLVVDGSRTTMRYIDSIFGGYCQIHLARTGIEAMDVVEIKPIDIIIMNRNLPDMDGFDLLEKWHKERLTDDISVVIAGDERNKQQEVEALQKGAADYISMPFVPGNSETPGGSSGRTSLLPQRTGIGDQKAEEKGK